MPEHRFIKKIIIIGDWAVGKTSLLNQFLENVFTMDYKPTLGYNILVKDFDIPEKDTTVNMNFWDIAGQTMFEQFQDVYFQYASGVMIVYDVTRSETFQNVPKWHSSYQKNGTNPNVPIVLVANKIDLKREVTTEQGRQIANENGFFFIETSALHNENVEDAFQYILDNILPEYLI